MMIRIKCRLPLACLAVFFAMWPLYGHTFGPDGHRIIGQIAYQHLGVAAAREVDRLLGAESLAEACNWPDAVRGQPGYETTGPLHYVNLPLRIKAYDAGRDCRNGNCVVAAVQRFSTELADRRLSDKRRTEALKFVCHFVGDIHQPLHVGYAHDRGGNSFDVSWDDQESGNLHAVWDSVLVNRLGPWRSQVDSLAEHCSVDGVMTSVEHWTNQSRHLLMQSVYPAQRRLSERYLESSERVVQRQLCLAGCRLANLLSNALSGSGQ